MAYGAPTAIKAGDTIEFIEDKPHTLSNDETLCRGDRFTVSSVSSHKFNKYVHFRTKAGFDANGVFARRFKKVEPVTESPVFRKGDRVEFIENEPYKLAHGQFINKGDQFVVASWDGEFITCEAKAGLPCYGVYASRFKKVEPIKVGDTIEFIEDKPHTIRDNETIKKGDRFVVDKVDDAATPLEYYVLFTTNEGHKIHGVYASRFKKVEPEIVASATKPPFEKGDTVRFTDCFTPVTVAGVSEDGKFVDILNAAGSVRKGIAVSSLVKVDPKPPFKKGDLAEFIREVDWNDHYNNVKLVLGNLIFVEGITQDGSLIDCRIMNGPTASRIFSIQPEYFKKVEPDPTITIGDMIEYTDTRDFYTVDSTDSQDYYNIKKGDRFVVESLRVSKDGKLREKVVDFKLVCGRKIIGMRVDRFKKIEINNKIDMSTNPTTILVPFTHDEVELGDTIEFIEESWSYGSIVMSRGDRFKVIGVGSNNLIDVMNLATLGMATNVSCLRFSKVVPFTPIEVGDTVEFFGEGHYWSSGAILKKGDRFMVEAILADSVAFPGQICITITPKGRWGRKVPMKLFKKVFPQPKKESEEPKETPISDPANFVATDPEPVLDAVSSRFPSWMVGTASFTTTVLGGLAYRYFLG